MKQTITNSKNILINNTQLKSEHTTIATRRLKTLYGNYFAEVAYKNINTNHSALYTSNKWIELFTKEFATCNITSQPQAPVDASLVTKTVNIINNVHNNYNNSNKNIENYNLFEITSNGNCQDSSATEEWTILDVNIGVPLFDVDCNTRICEQIAKHLSKEENLKLLPVGSATVLDKFSKFIKQCVHYEDELDYSWNNYTDNTHVILNNNNNINNKHNMHTNDNFGINLLLPRINLVFVNGRITAWNGQ